MNNTACGWSSVGHHRQTNAQFACAHCFVHPPMSRALGDRLVLRVNLGQRFPRDAQRRQHRALEAVQRGANGRVRTSRACASRRQLRVQRAEAAARQSASAAAQKERRGRTRANVPDHLGHCGAGLGADGAVGGVARRGAVGDAGGHDPVRAHLHPTAVVNAMSRQAATLRRLSRERTSRPSWLNSCRLAASMARQSNDALFTSCCAHACRAVRQRRM